QANCREALSRGGQHFDGDSRRAALGVALALCDALRLIVSGAADSQSLDAASLSNGLIRAGPNFPTAATFGSSLSETNHALPGFTRDLAFLAGCNCFTYRGGIHPI